MKPIRVFSAFNGMNCARIALDKLDIPIETYYSSEIDKYAIQVTQHNHPDTIQLGDICNIKGIDLGHIDLICGGSPCQNLSIASKDREGLQGKKSSLFYQFIRIFNELQNINPKIKFLFENVKMPDNDFAIISNYFKTYPIQINSSLVSAQMRNRFYWTNIGPESFDIFGFRKCEIKQPKDKKIYLRSILENGYTDRLKARALLENDSRPHVKGLYKRYTVNGFGTIVFNTNDLNPNDVRILTQIEMERLQTVPDGYTKCLSRNQSASVLGNGWTVDVIAHIFSELKAEIKTDNRQYAASLF